MFSKIITFSFFFQDDSFFGRQKSADKKKKSFFDSSNGEITLSHDLSHDCNVVFISSESESDEFYSSISGSEESGTETESETGEYTDIWELEQELQHVYN